jgi:RNA-binding protein
VIRLDKKLRKELRGTAQSISATVHVGKDGVTEDVAKEVSKQLDRAHLVKVRLLPSLEQERGSVADELAARSTSELIEVRGRTVVLYREGK